MFTTLNDIYNRRQYGAIWQNLLQHLDKTTLDDEPLPLLAILELNGLHDAVWSLRCIEGRDKEIRLFACDCACIILPRFENVYPDNMRPRRAIETASLYAVGLADCNELNEARANSDDACALSASTYVPTYAAASASAASAAPSYIGAQLAAVYASYAECAEVKRLFVKLCNGGYAEC